MKLQLFQQFAMRLSWPAIYRITDQGMPNGCHVDTHLVRPACLKAALDESCALQQVQSLPVRYRPLASAALDDGDLLAVGRRAGKRRIDGPLTCQRNARDDRKVEPVDGVGCELLRQTLMCDIRLGNNEQSGSVLVDAVDDPRAGHATDAGQ